MVSQIIDKKSISYIVKKESSLTINEEEKFEAAGLLKDDVGDSREERCKF